MTGVQTCALPISHVDGAPVQTTLTLQFREIEIVEKGRLADGKANPGQGMR